MHDKTIVSRSLWMEGFSESRRSVEQISLWLPLEIILQSTVQVPTTAG